MSTQVEPRSAVAAAAQAVLYRTLAVYFALFVFPFPFNVVPGVGRLFRPLRQWRTEATAWVGENLFGLAGPLGTQINGSGDRTVDYLQVLLHLIVALLAAAVWTAIARRRGLPRELALLRIGVRYYLAAIMFVYGFDKYSQFKEPVLLRLVQPYGESSPMGLLWTFMGYSPIYKSFAGFGEILGGALLLFRRTTMLGALVLVAVLGNVFMLNMSFDVPVKLLSFQLLVLAACLLWPERHRLAAFFLLDRPTAPRIAEPAPLSTTLRRLRVAAKVLVIALLLYSPVARLWATYPYFGPGREKPPMWGIFDVESYSVEGGDPSAAAWKRQFIEYPGHIWIELEDGETLEYLLEIDEGAGRMLFKAIDGSDGAWPLDYTLAEDGSFTLAGELDGKSVDVAMRYRGHDDFLLLSRGFRWINEYPYNR